MLLFYVVVVNRCWAQPKLLPVPELQGNPVWINVPETSSKLRPFRRTAGVNKQQDPQSCWEHKTSLDDRFTVASLGGGGGRIALGDTLQGSDTRPKFFVAEFWQKTG